MTVPAGTDFVITVPASRRSTPRRGGFSERPFTVMAPATDRDVVLDDDITPMKLAGKPGL
jgi:hypothetical protein